MNTDTTDPQDSAAVYWFGLWSLAWGAFWGALSWRLIEGYSQTGFVRPTDFDDDGNPAGEGLVVNDWWLLTAPLCVASLWLGVYCLLAWSSLLKERYESSTAP